MEVRPEVTFTEGLDTAGRNTQLSRLDNGFLPRRSEFTPSNFKWDSQK
jgi:hypothetical protein